MKFTLKIAAAAIALAASAGANAAITDGSGGNGSLFLSVWDVGADMTVGTTDDRAYVLDLHTLSNGTVNGGFLNDWATTASTPVMAADKQTNSGTIFSVAADANLKSFLAASTDLSRLQWNIAAGDNYGTQRALVTGVAGATTTLNKGQFFNNLPVNINGYIGAGINAALGSNSSVVLTGTNANIGLWGSNMYAGTDFNTAAALGQSLDAYLLSNASNFGSATAPITFQHYANDSWSLSNTGTLTYAAAVPEPETYGMLAAGLLMLGTVTRRRNRG